MPEKYLLPCKQCEASIEITARDAGRELNCSQCDSKSTAPPMREIRNLSPVDTDSVQSPLERPALPGRNQSKSWLFSGGLLLAVLAAVAGGSLWWYASGLETHRNVEKEIDFANQILDEATPGVVWTAWRSMSGSKLPDWKESTETRYNKQASILKNIAYGLGGLSGLGLLMMIGSFLIKSR